MDTLIERVDNQSSSGSSSDEKQKLSNVKKRKYNDYLDSIKYNQYLNNNRHDQPHLHSS